MNKHKLAVFKEQATEVSETNLVNRLLSWRSARQKIDGLVFSNAPIYLMISAELNNGILTVIFCDIGTHAYFGFTPNIAFTQVSDAFAMLKRIAGMLEASGDLIVTVQSAVLIFSGDSTSVGKSFTMDNLELASVPQFLFPTFHTQLISDFESSCRCLLAFLEQDLVKDYYQPMWQGTAVENRHPRSLGRRNFVTRHTDVDCVVIFAGQTLGAGTLLLAAERADAVTMSSNAYCSPGVPHPGDPDVHVRMRLLNEAARVFHRGKARATFADLVSFRGLRFLVKYYRRIGKLHSITRDTPDVRITQIAQAAYEDPNSAEGMALETVSKFLIQYVQYTCVAFRTQTVYLAGDLVGLVREYLHSNADAMRDIFLKHPVATWLNNVSLHVQAANAFFSLLGGLICLVES